MPRCRTPRACTHSTAAHRIVRRIREDQIKRFEHKKCGWIAIVPLPHRDFLRYTIERCIPYSERRLRRIQLNGENLPHLIHDKQRNDACPRPEIEDTLTPRKAREMREEHRIHRKTKFIRSLNDTPPTAGKIVEAFPRH